MSFRFVRPPSAAPGLDSYRAHDRAPSTAGASGAQARAGQAEEAGWQVEASPLVFPNASLETGLIVGHVTSTTARIWVRCSERAPCELLVREVSGTHGARSISVVPDADHDGIAIIDVSDLRPGTRYALDLCSRAGASLLPEDLRPTFRTVLPPDRWERSRFGLFSCHLPYRAARDGRAVLSPSVGMLEYFRNVLEAIDADFVLAIGDQVYADEIPALDLWARAPRLPDATRDEMCHRLFRQLYRGCWGFLPLQQVFARFPTYMIWDDHEIADNWGSWPLADGAERRVQQAVSGAARRAYDEYQHAHNPPTDPGVYHFAFDHGPVAFFVLDLRGQRDVSRRQMLGERQWRDLEQWLRATSDRPARFLVSSVPLVHVADRLVHAITRLPVSRHGPLSKLSAFFDRWSARAFRSEHARLMELLLDQPEAASAVTILSGDIHMAAALEFVQDERVASRVQQWTTSGLTVYTPPLDQWLTVLLWKAINVGGCWPVRTHFYALPNNFGLVEVTRAGDGRCKLEFQVHTWERDRGRHAFSVVLSPQRRSALLVPSR